MNTIRMFDHDCVSLENSSVSLLVTQSVGPRVISLRLKDGDNLFAVLPDAVAQRPDGQSYRFYGGHRLWHAPESMPRTYVPDDAPVSIVRTQNGLSITQPVEVETGIEKSIEINLVEDKAQVVVHHMLTNRGSWPVECAPWTITQLKPGGVAILPQSREQTGFLPNRSLVLWPYTDITSSNVRLGNSYHFVLSNMKEGSLKVGYPNPRGWIAYWRSGTLFVKRAVFNARAAYFDFGSSSECYCCDRFIELETLAPISTLAPNESIIHTETWELYDNVDSPENEDIAQAIVERLGLE